MPVDSPEYIARQRGDKGGGSILSWILIVVFIIGAAILMGVGFR